MNKDSPSGAFLIVLVVALVCSALVSTAVVTLRPIQLNNALLNRSKNIMQLTGLLPEGGPPGDEEMLGLFKSLDARVVEIDAAAFTGEIDAATFDQRKAASSADLGVAVPVDQDLARLGNRSRFATVYLVWMDGQLDRIILPIRGAGMWSMLYGYVALEADLNTVAGVTFYEQAETPGIGDQIMRPDWQAQWQGRRVFDGQGEYAFGVGPGQINPGTAAAQFRVDVLTGATVTSIAVSALMDYWFGPHGYQPFLERLRAAPPTENSYGEDS